MPEKCAVYKLIDPITFDGKTWTEINLRTPKVKELRILEDYPRDVDKTLAVISKLSGFPFAAFDEMMQWDFEGVVAVLNEVKAATLPQTGESSSDGSPIASTSNLVKLTG